MNEFKHCSIVINNTGNAEQIIMDVLLDYHFPFEKKYNKRKIIIIGAESHLVSIGWRIRLSNLKFTYRFYD